MTSCGSEVYKKCMESSVAATIKAAEIFRLGVITEIIRELVTGIKTKQEVADKGFPEELVASTA